MNNDQNSYSGFSRVRITGSRMAAEKKDVRRHPRDFAGKARTVVRQSMMAKGKPRHVLRSAPSLWVSRKSEAMRPRIYDFGPGTRACVVKPMSSRAIEDMWFQSSILKTDRKSGAQRTYVKEHMFINGDKVYVPFPVGNGGSLCPHIERT